MVPACSAFPMRWTTRRDWRSLGSEVVVSPGATCPG